MRERHGAIRPHPEWPPVAILVAFAVPCDAVTIEAGLGLRAIIVPSLGYEGIDVEAASRAGVVVANGQVRENVESVAEATIGLMLMGLYAIRAAEQRLRDNVARRGPPEATMLQGKTVGLIGFGNIARAVAHRLDHWGVNIFVHSRRPPGQRFPRRESGRPRSSAAVE